MKQKIPVSSVTKQRLLVVKNHLEWVLEEPITYDLVVSLFLDSIKIPTQMDELGEWIRWAKEVKRPEELTKLLCVQEA